MSLRPTRATIDLGALIANARALAARASGARVIAVIKADAYGHGAVPAARALLGARAADLLAVSTVDEGVELRDAGVGGPILILAGPFPGAHETVLARELTPVISDVADLEAFATVARRRGQPAGVHVEVDTGMARMGIPIADVPRAARALGASLVLEGIATHLASADVPGDAGAATTQAQLARFTQVRAALAGQGLTPALVHIANSAGILRFPEAHARAVRPGLALYGVLPTGVPDAPLAPVLRWTSAIAVVRELPAGAPVSYGGLWTAPRASRVATIPVGYADGYPRRATGAAQVIVGGTRCPVVGAVCMDLIVVDVTDVPAARVGDEVVLIGDGISPAEVAGWAHTIPYEVLTGVGKRVPRVYVPGATS